MHRAGAVAIVCAGIGCVDLLCVDAWLLPAWAAERRGAATVASASIVPERSAIAPTTDDPAPTIATAPDLEPTNAVTPTRVDASRAPTRVDPRPATQKKEAFAIRFAQTGSAELDAAAQARLAEIARRLQEQPDVIVRIEGHADARGARRVNVGLSKRRAQAVAAELRREGIADTRIAIAWSGEREPARKGSGAAVWAANRRVELQLREGE